ncbi:MAG TPA: carboxypeptidase-like regulatory domain-containing protein [Vicinamibacterales bacterium]|nr:carboxypeptidase-like regulatory domain-containing protein [Vicinamibacterales bacterium]
MKAVWIVLLTLALAPPMARPQGTASVTGTVVDDEEPAVPVRRAIVTVAGSGLVPSRSAITDDDGRFVIERLPAGRFTITVSRAAFITSAYGAKRPGRPGTPVVVAAGQRVTALVVKLWRGAVIAGVVRTEDGQPAEGLPVRVIAAHQTAEPSIVTLDNNGVKTNDAGEFRIFGLLPGAYLICVTPPTLRGTSPTATTEAEMDAALAALRTRAAASPMGRPAPSTATPPPAVRLATSRPFAYAPIYFPGTANLNQATPIALVPGQQVENINLQLQRVATASVSGLVTLADGRGASGASIQIMQTQPASYAPDAPLQATAIALPDGTFRIPAVSPGDYTLTARATPPGVVVSSPFGGPALWSEMQLSVSGVDLTGLTLPLESGPALTGRVAFAEGTLKPPADLTQWRVSLVTLASLASRGPVMGSRFNPAPPVALKADGTFEISGIPPGAFLFRLTGPALGPAGWWVRSMTAGDRDLLDRLIEIRPGGPSMNVVVSMSDRHTELSGTLRTSTGQPGADVFVIAFSSDRTMWGPDARRVRAVRPGADGHFSMPDLPPGGYLLGVVTDIDPDDWQNPAVLEQLVPTSLKVTLGEGEKRVQDLQLGRS